MPKASKRKSHDARKRSRSSSSGSRDKKRSVFDRLGTKALPLEPPLCRHGLQYGSCPNCSVNLSIPLLLNSFKRASKEKETKKSEEVDWSKWDSSELECEDEKSLERRRQLLKQQLGLHMISDLARAKAKSTSCSSSSSSSDISSSSSSSDKSRSSSPDIPSNRSTSSRGVMDDSVAYKSGKYSSPSSKPYKKKSVSPVFLRNPSPPKESKKKSMGRSKAHDDEDEHSVSRERRREERHRRERSSTSSSVTTAVSHHQNPYTSMSSRKKDDERSSRREESRRDRKSVSRSDSRSCQYEDMGRSSSSRYSERGCRERGRDRDRHRDSSKTSSRSNDGSRRRSEKDHYSRSCHDSKHYQQLSPSSHHHYRSERSSRYGSSERERLTVCKELSPRESDSRIRISSSSYSDSRSGRRRGWEGSRYDSPKSSRDWDQSTQSERGESRDWDRRTKPSDDKEFNSSDKEKESDWKNREREEDAASPAKRPRLEEPPPISEQLSDISDDPDDILNQDDVDEPVVGEAVLETTQKKEEVPVVSSNIEQSILDQKIRGEDSLSEISDEDLQLEEESKNKGDTLGVDWRSLVVECYHIRKSVREERSASSHSWDADSIFRRTGVCRHFAGDDLFEEIDAALRKDGGDGLLTDIGGLQRSKLEAKKSYSDMFCQQTALSARMDLMLRRQLCGLPILGLETRTLYQFQAI